MVYPILTDNFNLATLNANFLELYNQMNVAQSYTPTATNLGTIFTHTAMVKGGIGRYKLRADSGELDGGTDYIICTLDAIYRPTIEIRKEILLRGAPTIASAIFTIRIDGSVRIAPRTAISGQVLFIDETYMI